jgi:hypothetical protein
VKNDKTPHIYRHPNREIISLLLPREISPYFVEIFTVPLIGDMEERIEGLGTIGSLMARELLQIPGIEQIHVKPKEIRLKKGKSFHWPEIEKKAVKIVERALRRKEITLLGKGAKKPGP